MDNQRRLLLIQQYLLDHTDDTQDISSRDIRKMLMEKGMDAPDRRTIEADIDDLIDHGMDIHKEHRNGVPTRYRVVGRDFDTVELKILIDAVAASQFLSEERSRRLIQHLAELAPMRDREGLCAELRSLGSIKHASGHGIYNADGIYRAILEKKQIRYQMIDLRVPDLEPVPHKNGKVYTVSPYAMIWHDDRYYLIAYEEERDMIITPRVDHIGEVKILDDPIRPRPEDFDISRYYNRSFRMYTGPEMDVELICDNSLIGHVVDHFGRDFTCIPVSDTAFRATVRTSIGPTFFSWLFQYAGKMTLAGPRDAVLAYNRQRRLILKGPKEQEEDQTAGEPQMTSDWTCNL
ncbi:MAG: WYL domain-containing protein [Clostridia bacterium]|nr:WYL domain-containing protein [Clostridia bacterium]